MSFNLKKILTPLEQEWILGVDSHYYNSQADEVIAQYKDQQVAR